MAVSHKTNNIISCSGCHLPFNFNNSVPKSLPCKHWFCLACLEDMISKSDDFAHFDCVNCQQTIDIQGLNKTLEILPNADIETQISTRSASITSDNSIGCTLFFNNNSNNNNANNGHLNLMGGGSNMESGLKGSSFEQMSPGENCIIHGMPNTLWCNTCDLALCRGCNSGLEHSDHLVQNHQEARETYQSKIQQDIIKLQSSLGDIEQMNRIQRDFLLNILEGCCALKSHLESELANQTQELQIDNMKESVKKLQIHLEMMPEPNPQDCLKLNNVVKEEKQKFYAKHKEMLKQYELNEVINTNDRILDFATMQQILQKLDQRGGGGGGDVANLTGLRHQHQHMQSQPSNPMLHLTNYCIFHLYVRYTKQKQQFFENQLWRYQQYQQQIIANFKTQHSPPPPTLPSTYNQNNCQVSAANPTANTNTNMNSYDHHQHQHLFKRKTYAEIANSNTSSKAFDNQDAFDLFNAPLTVSQYKQLEEVGKCIDLLLLNPISNDNNHIYYFDFERNGEFLGRVLIKVYASYAPKMSYNFHALCTHEKGVGYRGCKVFKCYPNQSIITGDIDQNNGYGSRSIYEEPQFVPDDTKIPPFIGAVGMRRAKKIYDSQCLVGSQFRIILKVRPFSAIFGRVIEGLEVVWNISQMQIQNDKLNGNVGGGGGSGGGGGVGGGITVAQCGVYEFVKRNLSGAL